MTPTTVTHHEFATLMRGRPRSAAGLGLPLLIWSDVSSESKLITVNYHADFCSLYVVRRGRGTHVINGQAFAVARGDVYAMAPGMTHFFRDCTSLQTDTFHFAPTLFDDETRDILSATPGFHALFVGETSAGKDAVCGRWLHLCPSAHEGITQAVDELRVEWERGDATGTLLCRGLFLRLLVKLARAGSDEIGVAAHREAHEATVAAALRIMETRFTDGLRVEEIARAVFLSPDRFTEVFAQGVGRTPRDYLRYLRVEKAKTLLSAPEPASMTTIAGESGFGDAAYFARAFRAATGQTPSEWRKQRGAASL